MGKLKNVPLGCFLVFALLCMARGTDGSSATSSRLCDYGVLPGRFVVNGTFPAWRIFDPQCSLKDRLSGLLRQDQREAALGVQHIGAEQQAIKMILFGDSVEQWMTRDVCGHFTKEADNLMSVKDSHAHYCSGHRWNCAACSTHGFIFAREPSHGVLSTHGFEHSTLTLAERIPEVIKEFKDLAGPADIVSLSLNFWDLNYWSDNPDLFKDLYIPDEQMQLWLTNAEAVFKKLKDMTSRDKTTLIVKTTAFPALKVCDRDRKIGDHFRASLPWRAIIAQLNAAQRFLGHKYGFHIVDVESMLSSLGEASVYLSDEHHPSEQVNYEVLNAYLNLHYYAHVPHTPDAEKRSDNDMARSNTSIE